MTAEAGNATYRVALPEFEGPLDLLLHLCKTHEIDIVHIPIAFITEKYLEYLELMQSMPVDLAADYLVMAATLAYLKSRELVPSPEPLEVAGDGENEEVLDPREELIRRLLEYQKYKDAAEKLGARPIEGRNVFTRGSEIEGATGPAPLADHSAWKLIEAFGKLLGKAGTKLTHNVVVDRMSISERINQLIDRLEQGSGSFRLDSCFDTSLPEPELRSQIVVTILAVLELARLKVVRVLQSTDHETLFVSQIAGAALQEARKVHVTSAMEADENEDAPAEAGAEAPAVESAEAPAVESAEAPAVESAEAPAVESAAPAAESAEAPAVEGAEALTVESAEAPAVESAAPAVESAEAPAVESAEAPAVESAEAAAVESAEAPAVSAAEAPVADVAEALPAAVAQASTGDENSTPAQAPEENNEEG